MQQAHLFVLAHGLWGHPGHMKVVERAIENLVAPVSPEKIVTVKPAAYRFWKTYDGIRRCAERLVAEVLYEIETLSAKENLKVVKISFVGYSLGGLVSRYAVGILLDLGVFDSIAPIFFCTFATPHVGVHFTKGRLIDHILNFLGQYAFGYTGQELFLASNLLGEMAQPKLRYYRGLELFEERLLMANIKNDRTVSFYTSYISEHLPFEQWLTTRIKYLKSVPEATFGKYVVRPKVVDLQRLFRDSRHTTNVQEATPLIRRHRALRVGVIVLLCLFFLPFYIPIVLCVTFYVSAFSVLKVKLTAGPKVGQLWDQVHESVYLGGPHLNVKEGEKRRRARDSKHKGVKGEAAEITGGAMEGALQLGEDPASDSSTDVSQVTSRDKLGPARKFDSDEYDRLMDKYKDTLHDPDETTFPLFDAHTVAKLEPVQKTAIAHLNQLQWVKLPVYHDSFNAHGSIVARRGERLNPKGTCTIYLWSSLLRNHLRETSPENGNL